MTANIGRTYTFLKKYAEAETHLLKAIAMVDSMGNLYSKMKYESFISHLYSQMGDYKKAYRHFELHSAARDSIFNMEKNKELTRQEMKYEFEKKEALTKAEFDKKQAIAQTELEKRQLMIERNVQEVKLLEQENELKEYAIKQSETALQQKAVEAREQQKNIELLNKDKLLKEKELKQQQTLTYSFLGGGVLLLSLLVVAVKGYRQKQAANKLLSHQKDIIEEKNRDITDSIRYAKRIQHAVLPTQKLMNENLHEHFVLFRPKDIVSGDFYWAAKAGDKFFYAAADCTGHGVPGAFMSLIGTSFLNEIVVKKQIHRPDLILDELRENIIHALNPEGNEQETKDGMDITLCCLDKEKMLLAFASAFNGLYLVRHNTLQEFKGDKFPVGKYADEKKAFTLREIPLLKGDLIYCFSDGYADQFGGEKGKKFKYSQLKELLVSISDKPMHVQQQVLEKTFESWKGNLEQVDDVCVIGVRI